MTSQLSEMVMPENLAAWFYSKLNKGKILDIGCCTGIFGKYKPEGYTVYGIDVERDLLKGASKYETVRYGNAEKRIPFKNAYFDGIFCRAVLEHVRDYRTFMKELNRVTKKNGILILTCGLPSFRYWDDYDHFMPHSPVGMRKMCEDYGFKVIKTHYQGNIPFFGMLHWQDKAIKLMSIPLFSKPFRSATILICQKKKDIV
ncbi:MAG: class I SAM-dependent methyltransferase [archaeon]